MSSIPAKDVIYIDVDDEITAIIDKVRASQSKIIALVLPKRATTLQSIVNMKLLKRSADTDKKHLVLITAELGLMPLAANVGFYVAKTLQSKPEIPELPEGMAAPKHDESEEETATLDDSPAISRFAPTKAANNKPLAEDDEDGPIELDNTPQAIKPDAGHAVVGGGAAGVGHAAQSVAPGKKDKKLKVPNFSRFRIWIIAGGAGLVATILLFYVCLAVLPKATILVQTNSEAVSASLNLTLSTTAHSVNGDTGVVPAMQQKTQKTLTQQVAATGQKNNGQKAGGIVTATTPCTGSSPDPVPAGSGVSAEGKTFITQTAMSFDPQVSGKKCQFVGSVRVAAQQAGAAYNLSSRSDYIIAGYSGLTVSGDAMTGGTDQIIKIVQQSDIDDAKKKIETQDTAQVKTQLQNQLSNGGYFAIPATFGSSAATNASASAGDQAENVTVTENVTYTMLGAKEADLQKLIAKAISDDIDTKKQKITDYGLDGATFTAPSSTEGASSVTMAVTAIAGPELNIDSLKTQVAGKKTGDVKSIIQSNPGVTGVDVSYSPFWVHAVPGKTSKIVLTIEKPKTTKKSNADQ